MKITFLGTSAATSVPLAFCNCKACKQGRSLKGKDIRRRSSVVINDDLLIDLGPDAVVASLEYGIDITQIKYLLQTHAHTDHFDAGHFITRHYEYAVRNMNEITVVASEKTLLSMSHRLSLEMQGVDLFDSKWQKELSVVIKKLDHGQQISIDDYKVLAIESMHDLYEDSLIYFIQHNSKTLLYGVDLFELTEDAWRLLEGIHIDILILDQTYGKGYNAGGHFDAEQVEAIIRKMRLLHIVDDNSQIYATHLSHEGNDIHEVAEDNAMKSGYHIAFDGLTVDTSRAD
jgi:phosphoribosyl 1,2-cyclic phosphate phosphodiesterase